MENALYDFVSPVELYQRTLSRSLRSLVRFLTLLKS